MTEYELCERPIIEALESLGWRYVPGRELERESYEVPILTDVLRDAVRRLSGEAGIEIEDEDVERLILRLESGGSGAEGLKDVLAHLKEGAVPMDLGKKRGLRYIPIIDHEHPERNDLIVSNQVEFRSRGGIMRADIVLFVNGIPLVIIECKDPASENVGWKDAYDDIKSYERRIPEPFRYIQFGVAACDIYDSEKGKGVRVFPIIPWSDDIKPSVWRDEKGNAGIEGLKSLLSPETVLDLIRNFIFFTQKKGEDIRLFPRYMQYHAVRRIHGRVRERMLEGKEDADRGLIWHWQGSGKTYTMIFSAYRVYTDPVMEKPTIFFIVDRKELQDQMWNVIKGMDLSPLEVENVGSIRHLKEIIEHDGGRGKRGAFILLIQKFRPEKGEGIGEEELQELMKEKLISERKNIVLFIDEGHRTQYGILASQMRAIFRNAFMFAFTGTPVSKMSRNTYTRFSPPGEAYLHRYFIEESIRDGYTVPIVYRFVKEWMDFRKEDFEAAVESVFAEEDDETENEVAKRFNTVNEILSNPELIEKKAAHIVESFMKRENREMKAMVVAANRKACVLYKEAIDRHMRENYPQEWSPRFSEVVMTYSAKEKEPEIEDYRERMKGKYPASSFEQMDRMITEAFREKKDPQMLIVTDKLLAGFDAPVLQIMYLDKLMSGHNLLQAIARTNRPYPGKAFGLIIDYVGIFKRFKEALEEYYEMEGALNIAIDISELEKELISSLEEMEALMKGSFDPAAINSGDRDAINRALTRIMEIDDEENVESIFVPLYRRIIRIYELLGPSEIKVEPEIMEKMDALKTIYALYRKRFGKDIDPQKAEEYLKEVRDALYESMHIKEVDGKSVEMVLDEEYIEMLKSIKEPDDGMILDMTSVLNRYVMKIRQNQWADTVYKDIIDSIENAVERWRRRESDPEAIKLEYLRIMEEINDIEREKKALPIRDYEYPIFIYLKRTFGEEHAEDYVHLIRDIMKNLEEKDLLFPGWYEKGETRRKVGEEFRKSILAMLMKEKILPYQEAKEILDDVVDDIISILETGRP